MPPTIRKYYSTFLLALVPLLLISNANFESNSTRGDSEFFNQILYCGTKFKTEIETTYDGTKFSILKLYIDDDNVVSERPVEFIISKNESFGAIGPGKYQITKDKDGLLKYLDGVFGFLESKATGELPFFAHYGEITIAQLDEAEVNGSMNIYFKNAVGDSIHVKGNFTGSQ